MGHRVAAQIKKHLSYFYYYCYDVAVRRILGVRLEIPVGTAVRDNWEVVAGSGAACPLGDRAGCGDGVYCNGVQLCYQ